MWLCSQCECGMCVGMGVSGALFFLIMSALQLLCTMPGVNSADASLATPFQPLDASDRQAANLLNWGHSRAQHNTAQQHTAANPHIPLQHEHANQQTDGGKQD